MFKTAGEYTRKISKLQKELDALGRQKGAHEQFAAKKDELAALNREFDKFSDQDGGKIVQPTKWI